MKKTISLPIGNVIVYDCYIVFEAHEGATVNLESNKYLEDIADTYFANKKFVYITHRINSYAVDPAVYPKAAEIENLIGFTVVANHHLALSNAEIEKLFYQNPFEIFTDLEKAKTWAESIVKRKLA